VLAKAGLRQCCQLTDFPLFFHNNKAFIWAAYGQPRISSDPDRPQNLIFPTGKKGSNNPLDGKCGLLRHRPRGRGGGIG